MQQFKATYGQVVCHKPVLSANGIRHHLQNVSSTNWVCGFTSRIRINNFPSQEKNETECPAGGRDFSYRLVRGLIVISRLFE